MAQDSSERGNVRLNKGGLRFLTVISRMLLDFSKASLNQNTMCNGPQNFKEKLFLIQNPIPR